MLTLRARSAVLAAGSLLAFAAPASAAVDPTGGPALVANGQVAQIAGAGGGRALLRGDFSRIGRFTGPLVAIAPGSGARDPAFPTFDGQISTSVPDGRGGVYVGGSFQRVNGMARRGVAHVLADGQLDVGFRADIDAGDGRVSVWALALDGPTLYMGGNFRRVNGTRRERLAAVTAERGSTRPFSTTLTDDVRELAVAPAASGRPGRLFVGAGGLLGLDPGSGAPLPGFSTRVVGPIRALATDGGTVWVGGTGGLTAVDAATGLPRAEFEATPKDLSGEASAGGTVHTLLLDEGRLLAGGNFTALGGAPGPLVALDPQTGSADRAFVPQIQGVDAAPPEEPSGPESGVFALARVGEQIWAGGSFPRVEGRSAPGLVALDGASGRRTAVTPPALDGQVNTLSVLAGRLVTGGQSVVTGALDRDGLAMFDARTLRVLPAFPARRSPSYSLFFARGGTFDSTPAELLVGAGRIFVSRARFDGYAQGTRRRFLDETLTVRSFDARTGRARRRLRVRRLTGVTVLGSRLIIARRLDDRRRFPRVQIDVRSARTLRRVRSFRLPLRGYVSRLTTIDGRLYAAGSFRRRRPSGQQANLAVVRLDPRTGRVDTRFDPHVNGPVGDLVGRRRSLYLAGLFTRVAPRLRRGGLVALAPGSGSPRPGFRPSRRADDTTTLVPLAGSLGLFGAPAGYGFLSLDSGRRVDVPGVAEPITAAAALGGGRSAVSGTFDGPLGANAYSDAGLVRVVDR